MRGKNSDATKRASRDAARDNHSNRTRVSSTSVDRGEGGISCHFGSTDALVHVQPSRHASYPLQHLVQFGQMEGAWCDNGQTIHYDYDGSLSCNDRLQP